MGIGRNLKRELRELDMTVAELSRKSGVSTNTLYAIINRDSQKVRTDILEKICNNTDISIYELLYDHDSFPFYNYLAPEDPSEKAKAKSTIEHSLLSLDKPLAEYIIKNLQDDDMYQQLMDDYGKLNRIGRKEATKRVQELTEIPRYTDKDTNTGE